MSKKIIYLLGLLLMPVLVACSAEVSFRLDDNYSYLTITMSEESVENMIETLLTSGDSQLQNVTANLRNGDVYVTGEVRRNGTTQSGSLIVQIGDQNGLLDIEVTSFNFAGYTANQAGIDDFNERLANRIASNARDRENDSEFTDVTVTPTGLEFTIRTPRRE
ncbi:MAG: hypothetical protein AAFV98_10130 [Chloroflexota bacterium]